jgi:hypothetical protein
MKTANDCTIINSGCFLRRDADEEKLSPCVGLVRSDGTVEIEVLPKDGDLFSEREPAIITEGIDASEFLDELGALGGKTNFPRAVRRWAEDKKPRDGVKQLLLEAVE